MASIDSRIKKAEAPRAWNNKHEFRQYPIDFEVAPQSHAVQNIAYMSGYIINTITLREAVIISLN